ncbi:MAG: peptide chain release factor N(5)-glutamine methyltransferase, partial [Thermodesulfobacteriota bacterium]|nr:peptide chain release factor N(5)-glutamine methyltransferase [Thermodesulfobacteriota bacterium]
MRPTSWKIKDLLKVSADYLKEKNIESPQLTAEVLLAHQLKLDRIDLYLNFDQPLSENEISGYRSLIKRRLRHEPLQYITGVQEFWSIDFMVGPQVLVPRPETELLVELAIKRINTPSTPPKHSPIILDLGTGCGAIAVSLAKELRTAQVLATDISAGALDLARLNAKKHSVSDRIEFIQGDLWKPLIKRGIKFDLIVSNPPYVAHEDYDNLPPEVRDYEPRQALDGNGEGMSYIKQIITDGQNFMKPGAWMLIEMAPEQTEAA